MRMLKRALTSGAKSAWAHVANLFQQEVGYRLFTVTAVERSATRRVTRVWSSSPEVYPIGGSKNLEHDPWAQQLFTSQQNLICNSQEEIQRAFPDHETIVGLGCTSGVNLPVVLNGELLGLINIFNETHWFTPEKVDQADSLIVFAYAPLIVELGAATGQ
jgi:hypothetical protein